MVSNRSSSWSNGNLPLTLNFIEQNIHHKYFFCMLFTQLNPREIVNFIQSHNYLINRLGNKLHLASKYACDDGVEHPYKLIKYLVSRLKITITPDMVKHNLANISGPEILYYFIKKGHLKNLKPYYENGNVMQHLVKKVLVEIKKKKIDISGMLSHPKSFKHLIFAGEFDAVDYYLRHYKKVYGISKESAIKIISYANVNMSQLLFERSNVDDNLMTMVGNVIKEYNINEDELPKVLKNRPFAMAVEKYAKVSRAKMEAHFKRVNNALLKHPNNSNLAVLPNNIKRKIFKDHPKHSNIARLSKHFKEIMKSYNIKTQKEMFVKNIENGKTPRGLKTETTRNIKNRLNVIKRNSDWMQ